MGNSLNLKLEADAKPVEDLVTLVGQGGVRVPSFQRGLKWKGEDVVALFDSIYRGFPIGSILLRRGPAEAARVTIGPFAVDAPETSSALWVVDGQQRLTALTAGLLRPMPVPTSPDDPWVVYFDARDGTFQAPPPSGKVGAEWVPVAQLLDASSLSEWIFHWQHGKDASLRTAVFQAGSRIRQYPIPLYVVETSDEEQLRTIFYRTNNSGRPLTWNEVHDALFGREGLYPSTLRELGEELEKLGMGRPEEQQLLTALLAWQGLDPTQNLKEHYGKDDQVLAGGVAEALPALRAVLSFLKLHAEIPHLRLLPGSLPLTALTRFFRLFPEPGPRTITLLVRFVWRVLLNASLFEERTLLRRSVNALREGEEEESVQDLLNLVAKEPRAPYSLPQRFDARAVESRIALLGLASLQPRNLSTGALLDVSGMIEEQDLAAFRQVLASDEELGKGPANRIFLPGSGLAQKDILGLLRQEDLWLSGPRRSEILGSHAISSAAAEALLKGERELFLRERETAIEEAVKDLGDRLGAWSQSDRPSISYLIRRADSVE